MEYDFDEIIDRKNTGAVKLELMKSIWKRDDLLPLWVADMNFRTPSFIMNALRKRCEHEILGYTVCPEEWYTSIIQWIKDRYEWKINKEYLCFIPGIIPGIALAIKCFSFPGDKIMVQPPVYYPFFSVVKQNKRELIYNSLILKDGQYQMNFDRMREDIKGCKIFILCSPHNPGGRVWSKEELEIVADICKENNVLIFSDEIHADLTLPSYKHHPFATISGKASQNSIVFMSPSKTFNMPGLATSYSIIENEKIRASFHKYLDSCALLNGNIFAFISTVAAYTNGNEWLGQMLNYVQKNVDYLENYIKEKIPQIQIIRPQASFLVFLDCRKLKLSQKKLVRLFTEEAGLALNDGAMFGKEGTGFMRINVACSRSILSKALEQLEMAIIKQIKGKK